MEGTVWKRACQFGGFADTNDQIEPLSQSVFREGASRWPPPPAPVAVQPPASSQSRCFRLVAEFCPRETICLNTKRKITGYIQKPAVCDADPV